MEAICLAYGAVDQHVACRRKLGLGSPTPITTSYTGVGAGLEWGYAVP